MIEYSWVIHVLQPLSLLVNLRCTLSSFNSIYCVIITWRPHRYSVLEHRPNVNLECSGLFVRTCVWNVSRGTVHRSWQTQTVLLTWSALSFCFRTSRSLPLTLYSIRTKRCSRSLHLMIGIDDRCTQNAICLHFFPCVLNICIKLEF